jgi:hypothetical protein
MRDLAMAKDLRPLPKQRKPIENTMKPMIVDPIKEGTNAAGTAIGHIPRPMLALCLAPENETQHIPWGQ